MNIITILSSSLILLSVVIHITRVMQGKITLNIISWVIWSLISVTMYNSYAALTSGPELILLVVNMIYPTINVLFWILARITPLQHKLKTISEVDKWDLVALLIGLVSITIMWLTDSKDGDIVANITVVCANLCAVIPTFRLVKKSPMAERPLPWIFFACAFGLNILLLDGSSLVVYILPVYMFLGGLSIALPQVKHRLKNNLGQWY